MDDDEENPLLSSLVGLGSSAPKRTTAKKLPAKPAGKTVNASSPGVHPNPPTNMPKPLSTGRTMHSPPEGNLGSLLPASSFCAGDSSASNTSAGDTMVSETGSRMSIAASEAGGDLLGAFTTLKRKQGWDTGSTGAAQIESMSRDELVSVAKHLLAMVETFHMKMNEEGDLENMLHMSASVSNMAGARDSFVRSSGSGPPGSMVFRRRGPMERPSSGGSGESSMSIMRPPVVERGKLVKTKDDDGYKTINEYTIIAELGRGAYGKVKLACNENTGETVAIKIMKKSLLKNGMKESVVMREIAIMKKLRHRNVVSLFEVINDPDAEKMYLVMQYIQNGPLYSLNKKDMTTTPLSSQRVLKILRQLISGLRYLHKRNILHRDIKPDNILLGADDTPYLADFGVSEIAQTGSIHGMEGTPVFLAPELFRCDEHVDGCAVDVWALGVTIYGALYGKLPFIGRSYEQISRAVQSHPVHFPPENPVTPKWKDVISRLLEKDPKLRITLRDLKNHPVFDELEGKGPLENKEAVKEVEVTDLEVFESIRQVRHFSEKESQNSEKFRLGAKAKLIVHNFVSSLKKKVEARRLIAKPAMGPAIGGSGVHAIRGIASPASARRVSGERSSPQVPKHNPLTSRLPGPHSTSSSTATQRHNPAAAAAMSPNPLPNLQDGTLPGKKTPGSGGSEHHQFTPEGKSTATAAGRGSATGTGLKGLQQMPRLPSLRRTVRPIGKK